MWCEKEGRSILLNWNLYLCFEEVEVEVDVWNFD